MKLLFYLVLTLSIAGYVKANGKVDQKQILINKKSEIYAQVHTLEEGLYEVRITASTMPVKISIEDGEGIVIFSKIYRIEKGFTHQYDLREVGINGLKMIIEGGETRISEKL